MKLDVKCKVEQIVDTTRFANPEIANPYLDCADEKPKIIATNGYVLACINVTADKSEAGSVPVAAITEARRIASKRDDEIEIALDGKCTLKNNATLERNNDVQFVDWRREANKAEQTDFKTAIGINVKQLAALANALGSATGIVQLEILDNQTCMRVKVFDRFSSETRDDRFGLIMPVSLGNSRHD